MTDKVGHHPHLATSVYTIDQVRLDQHNKHLNELTASTSKFPLELEAQEILQSKTPLLHGSNVDDVRASILRYFHAGFTLFEKMHDILANDNVFYFQPEHLRHPLLFYFGHTAVFFVNKLNVAGILKTRVNPVIESMCAIGVDEMSWDDLNPQHYNWPSINQLREYRSIVRGLVDNLIRTTPLTLPITWESPFWPILMGCEHERIHIETSSVLFRQLPSLYVCSTPLFTLYPTQSTSIEHREKNNKVHSDVNQLIINDNKHLITPPSTTNNTDSVSTPIDITETYTVTIPQTEATTKTTDQNQDITVGSLVFSSDIIAHLNVPSTSSSSSSSSTLLDSIADDSTTDIVISSSATPTTSTTTTTSTSLSPYDITLKHIPPTRVMLGKDYNHHLYGWDNEYGYDDVAISSQFDVSTTLVTNRQYLHFILDGGYHNEEYWTDEGWRFAQYKVNKLKQPWPVFWIPQSDEYNQLVSKQSDDITTLIKQNITDWDKNTSHYRTTLNSSSSSASPSLDDNTSTTSTNSDGYIYVSTSQQQTATSSLPSISSSSTTERRTVSVPYLDLSHISQLHIKGFSYRWLCGVIDMPWDWPVDINNLEAQAYAKWVAHKTGKPFRLFVEAEYKALQQHVMTHYGPYAAKYRSIQLQSSSTTEATPSPAEAILDMDYPLAPHGLISQNINLSYASSSPVDALSYLDSGIYDVIGNVWQHCASVIYPFSSFHVHPIYDDFTVPTYDNMHNIIAGGSWISTGNEAGYHSRYAFRRHFYQHAGCRLVLGGQPPAQTELKQSIEQDPYIATMLHNDLRDLIPEHELSKMTSQYIPSVLRNLPVQSVQLADIITSIITQRHATMDNILVLGCRSGRLPLELLSRLPSQTCRVTGIDTTVRLLGATLSLLSSNQVSYIIPQSYSLPSYIRIRPDALLSLYNKNTTTSATNDTNTNILSSLSSRLTLLQTDVCNLPPDKVSLNHYNIIVIDMIERAYDPEKLLSNITRHATSGALIFMTVSHNWETSCENKIWGQRNETTGELVTIESYIHDYLPSWTYIDNNNDMVAMLFTNKYKMSCCNYTTYIYQINK